MSRRNHSLLLCAACVCVAVCGGVVQFVTMRCSTLQYVAVCCSDISVLQCVAVCGNALQRVMAITIMVRFFEPSLPPPCCGVLQCVAVCCSVLQCVAVCCSVLQCVTVCCSVLQCVAVCDCVVIVLCFNVMWRDAV